MKRNTLSALVGGMMALAAMSATAGPILIGTWASSNSGVQNELDAAQAAITSYNTVNDPDLPAFAGISTVISQDKVVATYAPNDKKIVDWTAPETYDFYYILTKYGQGNANFDTALHYVLAGEVLNYNPGGAGAPNGLSHASIWGANLPGSTRGVPDGGWSLALLGLGAFGVSRLRR